MSEPRALVEHCFRHEFGRLCAVLTRSLGVRRLALVEDVVQAALVQALETWSRRGVPEDPAGWLRAVAEAYLHGPQAGLERLAAVPPTRVPARYPGWHAVIGRAPFPPRPTRRRRARLAGSPPLYHGPRQSRILASPPRRLPPRWRRARHCVTPAPSADAGGKSYGRGSRPSR